jgi:hypothetical protein
MSFWETHDNIQNYDYIILPKKASIQYIDESKLVRNYTKTRTVYKYITVCR